MSGTGGYGVGSIDSLSDPTLDEANQALLHALSVTATGVPVGLLSSLLPNPNASGVASVIPFQGAAANLVQTYRALDDFSNTVNTYLPSFLQTPDLPQPTSAYKWADDTSIATMKRAEELIPHVEPTSPEEQVALHIGEAGGSMGVPLPFTLPGKIGTAASYLLPGLHSVAAPLIGIALTAMTDNPNNYRPATPTTADNPQPVTDNQALPTPPIPPQEPPLPTATEPTHTFDGSTIRPPTFGAEGDDEGWSVGGILATVAGGVALMAGAKYARGLGGGIASSARNARFLELSKSFNDEQAARWRGDYDATQDPKTAAPLPGAAGGILKDAQTYVVNKNAQLNAYLDVAARSPDIAGELKAAVGNVNNDMAWDKRITEQMKTGVDPGSGMSTPSIVDWSKNVANLDANKQKLLNFSLYADDELDTRLLNFKKAQTNPSATLNDPGFRHNLYNMDSGQLRALVSAAEYDPEVKALRDIYFDMQRKNIDIGEQRGFLTTEEANKIRAERPHYVPTTDVNGQIDHTFGLRSIEPFEGVEQIPTLAWEAAKQHYEGYYRQLEVNDLRRAITYAGVDFQRRNPDSARMFTEKKSQVTGGDVPGTNENVLPVRTDSGIKYFYVDNPDILSVLKNSSAQSRTAFDGLNYIRQLYQQGTTGIGALINGRWFPPINMGRTALLMGMDRTAGTYGGMVDRTVNRASSGRLGYRGPDPTNLLGAGYSAGADIGNDFAHALGSWLAPEMTNPMALRLRSIIGDQAVNAISQKLLSHYANSATAEMRAQGIGGQGSAGGVELPAHQLMGGQGAMAYSPLNNLVPQLYRIYGPMGWATPTYVRLRNLVSEVSNAVSDGGHSYYWRLNRDNPNISKNVLANETRQLTGDPGTHGSGKGIRMLTSVMPYSNITIQDDARLLRVLNEAPVAGAMSIATTMVTAALGSIFSAMTIGPAAINHLENELTTQQREAGVILYTNPDPTKASVFSLPQRLRGIYPAILDMTAAAIGAFQAHTGEDAYAFTTGILRDFFSHHITNSNVEATKHGVGEMVDPFLGIPTWANAIANIGGVNIRPEIDSMYNAAQDGSSIAASMVHPITGQSRVPNQQGLDSLKDSQDGKVGAAILSSLFGVAGGAWGIVTGGIGSSNATDDPMYALGGMGADWFQHFKDNAPFANNMIWSNAAKLSVRNPLEENVTRTMNIIKPTLSALGDVRNEGLTRSRGEPVAGMHEGQVPTDPQMREMYFTVAQVGRFIETKLMPPINDIKKQISGLDGIPLRPDTKRDMNNQYVRQLNSKYEQIYGYINDLNHQLSIQAGTQVHINSINWHKDMSQFNSK